jgi:hypothetical protein
MATIELVSVNAIEGKIALVTVKVTIGDEEFIQEIGNVPTTEAAARKFLQAYADDYETGLAAARAAEENPPQVDSMLSGLVGQEL